MNLTLPKEITDELQLIMRTAGDLDEGIFFEPNKQFPGLRKPRRRGNIGGVVTRALERIAVEVKKLCDENFALAANQCESLPLTEEDARILVAAMLDRAQAMGEISAQRNMANALQAIMNHPSYKIVR